MCAYFACTSKNALSTQADHTMTTFIVVIYLRNKREKKTVYDLTRTVSPINYTYDLSNIFNV